MLTVYKRIRIFKLMTIFLFLGIIFSCGKKGPPVPPKMIVPKAIKDLAVRCREGKVVASWSVPAKNTDNSKLIDLKGFRILRSERGVSERECSHCGKKFLLLADIDREFPRGAQIEQGKVTFVDNNLSYQMDYAYKVVSYNAADRYSDSSNPANITWDAPPFPPPRIQGKAKDNLVVLLWENSEYLVDGSSLNDLAGYNVYRRERNKDHFELISKKIVRDLSYNDIKAANEHQYLYAIRAVRKVGETLIESKNSREIIVVPFDSAPPAPPLGLIAIPGENGIFLKWKENPESDLAGYNVYRREEGSYRKKINAKVLNDISYLDILVGKEKTYFYVVTAVDNSPRKNESEPSQAVELIYLP